MLLLLVVACAAGASAGSDAVAFTGDQHGEILDSNVAFYEGETLNYVVYPPDGFGMLIDEPTRDGYSFAFVPEGVGYDTADVLVGVNIYKIRGLKFDDVLTEDTLNIRSHFGDDVLIRPVDSVMAWYGDLFTVFYIDLKQAFIPNVMIGYFDGGTEMLIFELVISEKAVRPQAEAQYIQCLQKMKAMPLGELGAK